MSNLALVPSEGPKPMHVVVAENIRAESARRNVKHIALARHLGISTVSMSAKMRGATPFTLNELDTVSRLLGTSVAALVMRRETTKDPAVTPGLSGSLHTESNRRPFHYE